MAKSVTTKEMKSFSIEPLYQSTSFVNLNWINRERGSKLRLGWQPDWSACKWSIVVGVSDVCDVWLSPCI